MNTTEGPGHGRPGPEQRPVRYKPGKAGLDFFTSLVERALPAWSVDSLVFSDPGVEFTLSRGSRRLSYVLTRPGDGQGGMIFSNRVMGLRKPYSEEAGGKGPPSPEARGVDRSPEGAGGKGPGPPISWKARSPQGAGDREPRALFSVFGAAPFDLLLGRLKADGLLYTDPHGPRAPGRLDRFFRRTDHGLDWWKFFYPRQPALEEEVSLGSKVTVVSHCSPECRFNGPQESVASLRLFADERRPPPRRNSGYYDTDLREKDVLEGRTLAVLASKLREAAERDRPSIIHLMTTCLPELVGDDPRPIMKRLEREFGVKIVWTSKTRDPGVSFNDVLSGIVAGVRFSKKLDPRTVILAGAPDDAAAREMTRLLGTVGLKVAGSMFPDLDRRKMRDVRNAGALVWVNPVGWEKISDEHFIRSGLKVVRFHPPFGIRGTVEWLGRVCSVLGMDPSLAAGAAAPHSAGLAALRRECRERTVALIGDRADLSAMVQKGQPMGFSAAAVLSEMGFQVRCLVLDPDGKTLRRGGGSKDAPAAPGAGPGGVEFQGFRTSAELGLLLADGVDLAFTHLNHDPRLAARGVAGFCEEAFKLGVEGFLETGHRLLRRIRTRPFPRHQRYLLPGRQVPGDAGSSPFVGGGLAA